MGWGISKGDLKAVEDVTGMSESDVKEAYKGFKEENKADSHRHTQIMGTGASIGNNRHQISQRSNTT